MTEVLYLTTVGCADCGKARTFAHRGPWVQADHDPPLPDVDVCPKCGAEYPDDLGIAVQEIHEGEVVLNPDVAPEDR